MKFKINGVEMEEKEEVLPGQMNIYEFIEEESKEVESSENIESWENENEREGKFKS